MKYVFNMNKDNTMSANTGSYFVFQIATPDDPVPKPMPEWPPVEPTPVPPTTEPPSTVPPVTSLFFQGYSFMLN